MGEAYSCNKSIDPANKKQITETKYQIINQVLATYLDSEIKIFLKKDVNFPFDIKKQIFETSVSIEHFTYGAYDNLIPDYYDINTQDSLYPIKKWNKHKLDNYKIIDTTTYNQFKKLYDSDIEVFLSLWEKEIGLHYMNISNPIFNSDFTKCLIYFHYTDFDWRCGTGKNRMYEFTKEGNNWLFKKDLLEID